MTPYALSDSAASYTGSPGDGQPVSTLRYGIPPGAWGKLRVFVGLNSFNLAADVVVYKNGAPTALKVTVGAGATGVFSDLLNAIAFAEGDDLALVVETGDLTNPGTSMIVSASVEKSAVPIKFSGIIVIPGPA